MDPFTPTSDRPPCIEQLRAEVRGLPYRPAKRKKRPQPLPPAHDDIHSLFTVESGSRWMELFRREPQPKMLLGELWHQNELCILFADTNTGKSVLAVQIADSLARGQSIAPFTCQAPPAPARVLYLDFELDKLQFGLRYSHGDEDHPFSPNFFRAQYNFLPDPPPHANENELLIAAIEYKIQRVKATVLIIDNITCLRGGTENAAVALSLMKSLKALKTDHHLSILVLAHTPKRRNPTQPISADDLHGSKLLINFADSAFAIGKSTAETGLCYLKQIKQRNTSQRYGPANVCLCRIQKPGAFLHFQFEGYSAEHQHLLSRSAASRQDFANKIADLSAAGLSQREISKQLGIGLATVNRLLRYADEEEFENLKMSKFEDEGEFTEEANDERYADCPMTNDTMTNDVMTNDQKGCADMQMCGCADGEQFENLKMSKFENEEESAITLMTNDVMTNDHTYPMTNDTMTNDQTYPMTNDVMTNDQTYPMTNDVMTNDQTYPMTNDIMTNDQPCPMTNDVMTNDQKESLSHHPLPPKKLAVPAGYPKNTVW
ncbi:AAA family ATPase [uncultured Mucilaginibacter sp.]|uniref:AAA family ATPase n=1 Tax=uncultured Mucilaginibacter sp. TaxID=797541 RepID=UPI002600AB13|nr:AAA family ATPase [uncultured Mucilaginibacter sp.]